MCMDTLHKTKAYAILDWKRYLKRNNHPITESFLESYGVDVYKHSISAIRTSLETNTDEITLFAIKSSIFLSVLMKEDYYDFLESALEWLIECEEYEMCSEIKNIMDSMSV